MHLTTAQKHTGYEVPTSQHYTIYILIYLVSLEKLQPMPFLSGRHISCEIYIGLITVHYF